MASESSSLNVTGESVRDVNAYGSTIVDESVEGHPERMEMEQPIEESEVVITCTCKGQCAKKKGRGSCPCKAANKSCCEQCRCNPSKCKNKPSEEATTNRRRIIEPNAEVQFQNDMQTSLAEIQVFVASLDVDKKDQVLVNLLSMGRGSLDFAKNLVGAGNNPPPPQEASPEWCKCKRCRQMDTDTEKVCCKRVRCITLLHSFSNICLDRDNLEVTIKSRCDFRADEFDFTMESFRKAAYYRYTIWRFGKLGRGNRRVVPSCVVWAIRDTYQSANGQYMGFRSS